MPAQKRSFNQRVAEYVDSPLMTQRLRYRKRLSARIDGNFGAYRTEASQTKRGEYDCSCPSEIWPCKHVEALRATWKANPDSFFDLDEWFRGLAKWPKAELVGAIRKIVIDRPEVLALFDIPGFEEEDDDEDDEFW